MDKIFLWFKRGKHSFDISLLLLIAISILAFFLRIYGLGEIPSFHTDEADFANNAYSIIKTGKDQTGRFFPLTTSSTGDERPSVYMYATVIAMYFFGTSEFAVRLPSLLLSTATVAVVYMLTLELFRNKQVALIASFLMAISFWHIGLSREASEKSVALFFVTIGIYYMVRHFVTNRTKHLFIGLLLLFVSTNTYYSPKIFLVFFLPAVWFLLKKKLILRKQVLTISYTALFILVTLYLTFIPKGNSERISQLSVFKHPYTIAILGEQLREDGSESNILLSRLFHNKVVNYGLTVIHNFAIHYSPQFLFLEGGEPKRIKVPQTGLLPITELPFFAIGLFLLLQKVFYEKKKEKLLFPLWILLSGIPAAFTFDETPNIYRTSLSIPAYSIIAAYGLLNVFQMNIGLIVKRIILVLTIVFFSWETGYFLHQYFIHFERHRPVYRNYAQKQLGLYLKNIYQHYDAVFVTKAYGGTEQVVRYYMKYDPIMYMNEGYPKDKDYTGFGTLRFVPENCPFPLLFQKLKLPANKKYLFINNHDCDEYPSVNYHVIRWGDESRAYSIVDSRDISSDLLKQIGSN